MLTKKERILLHLKRWKYLTPREAIELYNAFRLAAVIFQLKKEGHNIITHNMYDCGVSWAKYEYKEKTPSELF